MSDVASTSTAFAYARFPVVGNGFRVGASCCPGAVGDAWRAVGRLLRARGELARLPRFAHGARCSIDGLELVASFHPSRLNTQTGRLTERMFDSVLARATKSLPR